jgi:hypothetical protein
MFNALMTQTAKPVLPVLEFSPLPSIRYQTPFLSLPWFSSEYSEVVVISSVMSKLFQTAHFPVYIISLCDAAGVSGPAV